MRTFIGFDLYTFRARVAPMFIVLLPLGIAGSALWNGSLLEALGAVVLPPAVLATLVAELGRDLGKRKEPRLWAGWGGPPTTQLLRHWNAHVNPIVREHRHALLRRLDLGVALPSPEQEIEDPDSADRAYEACVRILIGRTRHDRLLLKENTSYGFRRNLWGLKPAGLTCTIGAFAIVGWNLWNHYRAGTDYPAKLIVSAAVLVGLLVCWIFVIRPAWVRIPADACAERLFEAAERLERDRAPAQ